MKLSRPKLTGALLNALTKAQQTYATAVSPEAREKSQQLIVSLQQALIDVDNNREAQVLGLSKWSADWIPNTDDPLRQALDDLEEAAIKGL